MKGIVYKIVCKVDSEFCYYGSTIQTLNVRWNSHKKDYKRWKEGKGDNISTHEYYNKYGIENFNIELVEELEFEKEGELEKREQYYIDTFDCVNIRNAFTGLTKVEYKAEYYQKNKEKLAERKAEWYQKNKEELNEKRKEKVPCVCGSIVSKNNLARHNKSQKHQNYLNSLI